MDLGGGSDVLNCEGGVYPYGTAYDNSPSTAQPVSTIVEGCFRLSRSGGGKPANSHVLPVNFLLKGRVDRALSRGQDYPEGSFLFRKSLQRCETNLMSIGKGRSSEIEMA